MARLTTTEGAYIDLVAMRKWHLRASLDSERAPDIRRWHRSQVDWITKRLFGEKNSERTRLKMALIEILSDAYRTRLHQQAGQLAPFAWGKFCEEARKEIKHRHG